MRSVLRGLFRFLPVQLLLLHFRKYQLLLIFWFIITATVMGNFASHFGASTLFLSPEYLGHINFASMFLLGGSMAVFVMSWHITTFIIHSHRMPFMGAARQSFLKYCINNSLLPLAFLIFYSIISIRFQNKDEHAAASQILVLQLGFYLGFMVVIMISFAYFFRMGRDLLKTAIIKITNPSRIRSIVPYDTLDYEYDLIHADTYISETLRLEEIPELDKDYNPRMLVAVLRRHHRNAITATLFAFIFLLLMGIFMEEPMLRIPAAAGFLILFSVMTGLVGAVKYFLKSWELISWLVFASILSLLVHYNAFDLRSIAYGMNYHTAATDIPEYSYESLRTKFTNQKFAADKDGGIKQLNAWKRNQADTLPPLIVITVSGGGSRSAYWTFHSLQYLDSATHGKLFDNTVLITGASGGAIGAAYWRAVHEAYKQGKIKNPYDVKYQENIGKDVLNAIIFSLASVDLISPFNKVNISGYSYTKDRGYAMEQELIRNTDGLLDQKLRDYQADEANGKIPMMVVNGTIVNDGRRLLMAAQPVSYLSRPSYTLSDTVHPQIDAIDFGTFFAKQDPYNLRLTTALRMNATFPFILPTVRLPSHPSINVMDAGLRDNFGMEVTTRFLYVFKDWIKANSREVIFLQIRDTKEYEVLPPSDQNTLGKMVMDPLFVIQNKWEPIQSYYGGYFKDYIPWFLDSKINFITMQYIPKEGDKMAALNFHLTEQEKTDIYFSIFNSQNQEAAQQVVDRLK